MKSPLPSSFWFWTTGAILVLAIGLRLDLVHQRNAAHPVPSTEIALVPIPHADYVAASAKNEIIADKTALPVAPLSGLFIGPPTLDTALLSYVGPPVPVHMTYNVIADTLKRNDSIYTSLKKHALTESEIGSLNSALKGLGKNFNPKHVRPKDSYTLEIDTNGIIQRFEYIPYTAPERPIVVKRQADRLVAQRLIHPLTTQTVAFEVKIRTNLSNAISAAGENDQLTDVLADRIFGAIIDFQLDPRPGDRVGLVFEKLYKDDRFIRYGHILLARYQGQKVTSTGMHYKNPEGYSAYYDPKGKSLERLFLMKPLSFRRISSKFNRKRFHPVLKKARPHLGVDYAAATGTKVWTTARGTVTYAQKKGGYGLLVEVQHPNGFRTRYAHLSRIHVKKGQRLQQQELIGRVGSSGLATGPHLHYELIKNGRHIDPQKANKNTKGQPLEKKYRHDFAARQVQLLSILENAIHSQPTLAVGNGP